MSVFDERAFQVGAAMSSHPCFRDGAKVLPYDHKKTRSVGWKCKRCGSVWSLRVRADMTKRGLHAMSLAWDGVLVIEDERKGVTI